MSYSLVSLGIYHLHTVVIRVLLKLRNLDNSALRILHLNKTKPVWFETVRRLHILSVIPKRHKKQTHRLTYPIAKSHRKSTVCFKCLETWKHNIQRPRFVWVSGEKSSSMSRFRFMSIKPLNLRLKDSVLLFASNLS